jgi:glycosyltransferase involved in cell wall biosynthesis
MHGADFYDYLPPPGTPLLATLHLPVSWYPIHALIPRRSDTWLNCVSRSQHATCIHSTRMLPPIPNGTAVDYEPPPGKKNDFALVLGRICPEKGIDIALNAAKQAGIPLLIAGEIFSYLEHQQYFETMIKPRLDQTRHYIGPVGLEPKRKLLAQARCLVVSSRVPETSSLVAQEALAAGTPVVAFARGAMPETIDHGRTGYLVSDEQGLAAAMHQADAIDPEVCRAVARERFSADRMIENYFQLYRRLARHGTSQRHMMA